MRSEVAGVRTASTFLFRCAREPRERSRVGRRGSRRSLPVCANGLRNIHNRLINERRINAARSAVSCVAWIWRAWEMAEIKRMSGAQMDKRSSTPIAVVAPSGVSRRRPRVRSRCFEIAQWWTASIVRDRDPLGNISRDSSNYSMTVTCRARVISSSNSGADYAVVQQFTVMTMSFMTDIIREPSISI